MKRLALTTAGVFAAMLAARICAAPEDATPAPAPILSTEISGGDLGFFTRAARQIALVRRLSELAKTRAVTPEVQGLAASVWKDETDAAARLKELAKKKDVPLPAEPDGEGKELLQTLEKLKGLKFDKTCVDALGDSQDLIETSLEIGAASRDKDIRSFAGACLEMLKQERERIRKLGL